MMEAATVTDAVAIAASLLYRKFLWNYLYSKKRSAKDAQLAEKKFALQAPLARKEFASKLFVVMGKV